MEGRRRRRVGAAASSWSTQRGGKLDIAVHLEPSEGSPPTVEYRWDADTDILTAHIDGTGDGAGPSGSVELEAPDGSWLILDVVKGRIAGVEVAVWPDVHKRSTLAPPAPAGHSHVVVPFRAA